MRDNRPDRRLDGPGAPGPRPAALATDLRLGTSRVRATFLDSGSACQGGPLRGADLREETGLSVGMWSPTPAFPTRGSRYRWPTCCYCSAPADSGFF